MAASDPTLVSDFERLMTGAGVDVGPLYDRCRSNPAFWSDRVGGWVVSRHCDVSRVLRDENRFPPLTTGPGSTAVYGRTVLQMTGKEHRRKIAPLGRRLRNPRFVAGEMSDVASEVLRSILVRIPGSVPIDLRAELFSRFPMTVIARLMGIEEAAGFRQLYGSVVAAATSNMQGDAAITARADKARAAIYDMLRPAIQQRRNVPTGDLLAEVATMTFEDRALPDDEVLAYALFLFVAGVETTERTLCNLTRHLVDHPEDWSRMTNDRSLVLPAIAETLRHTPPVHGLTRGVAAPTELGGVDVPAGCKVLALIGSANRDPEVFAEPEAFVLDRFGEDASREFTAASRSLAFGTGLHQCTGSMLAKLELDIALNAMADRFRVITWAEGSPPDRGYVLRAPPAIRVICVER